MFKGHWALMQLIDYGYSLYVLTAIVLTILCTHVSLSKPLHKINSSIWILENNNNGHALKLDYTEKHF